MAKSFTLDGTLRLDSRSFNRKLKGATRAAAQFGMKLGSIGFKALATGAAAATAAAVGFGVAAARSIAQFGMEMSKVKALTGATAQEFAELEAKARSLGATTVFSASEAAAGMSFLAMAGFKTNEILKSSEELLNLAAAGGLDLAEAMDIASNIMKPFNMEADESGRTADVLALTAASANTNVSQLGEAMKQVAPVANQLGISFEETSAAIGVLGNAGIQATMAGTALRNIMARLVKPTSEVTQGLDLLGLEAEDVSPATNTLTQMFEKFQAAAAKVNDKAKVAAAGVGIFGLRAMSAGGVLMQTVDDVRVLTEELKGAEGAAKDMAKTMLDNLGGDLKLLKSAFVEVQLAVGKGGLTDVLREAAQWATELMRQFADTGKAAAVGRAIRAAADAFRGVFVDTGQAMNVLKTGLEFAFASGLELLHNGLKLAVEFMNTGFGETFKGLKMQASGWVKLVGNGLLLGVVKFVKFFQEGIATISLMLSLALVKALEEFGEGIAKIPGVRTLLGVDKDFEARSLKQLMDDTRAGGGQKALEDAFGITGTNQVIKGIELMMDDAAKEVSDGAHKVANWMEGLADGSTRQKAQDAFLKEWKKLVEAGLKDRVGPDGIVGDAPALEGGGAGGREAKMDAKGRLMLKGQKHQRGQHWQDRHHGRNALDTGGLDSTPGGLGLGVGAELGFGQLGSKTKGAGRGYNQVRRGDAKRKKEAAAAAAKKAEEQKLDIQRNNVLEEQLAILKGAFAPAAGQ